MDNVTHTLISVVIGEAAHRSLPPSAMLSDRARRTIAIGVMAVGGNLPDADVIYTGWAGSTLDYLLHHRGHTHTVLGALGLSVLLFAVVRLWWRHRKVTPGRSDIVFLAALCVVAPLLHIGLDFTNSYGVHPLWPIDNRWYYGDSVFIVEPLLWACAAVLLFTLPSRVMRILVAVVLGAGFGLSWFTGFVPVLFAALLTVLTLGLAALSRWAPARVALAGGVAAWLLLTATFVVTARTAKGDFESQLAQAFPAARTLDTVLTPLPANPVCRDILAVQVTEDRYVLRRAFHSLAPALVPARECAEMGLIRGTETTAALTAVPVQESDAVSWVGELAMPVGVLATLASEYCAVDALMQFARAPWAREQAGTWIVGDLRYDMEPGLGLAEVEVGPGRDECPRLPAPWVPPREDLLDGE